MFFKLLHNDPCNKYFDLEGNKTFTMLKKRNRSRFARQPENSKRARLRVPALQTPPKFHEKTPEREKKERKCGREGKKERIFWRSGGGRSRGGASTSTTTTTTTPTTTQQKNGLAQIGLAQSRPQHVVSLADWKSLGEPGVKPAQRRLRSATGSFWQFRGAWMGAFFKWWSRQFWWRLELPSLCVQRRN